MNLLQIEKLEIDLLLTVLRECYGYDFQSYTKSSVRRRVRHLLSKSRFQHVSELIPSVLYDPQFAQQIISDFSITVTEMFRDPLFYQAVREKVVPYLKTYPFIKVWHAGCATGEEVYSLAILLLEEEIYSQATIFATDFNEDALQKAKEGIYLLKQMQSYTSNYQQAGGRASFADYYHAQYEYARMDSSLRKHLTFANHNLVTDGVFSEMQLIFCRNVLIYFDRDLQNHVLELLSNSLALGGFLCLGTKELLEFSTIADQFRLIDEQNKIYQKHAG